MQYKLQKIKSDASFREFFRLFKGKKTSIIVTASKEKFKNLTAYSIINKFLRINGIHTPKLISQHINEGIIEIEDFGYKTNKTGVSIGTDFEYLNDFYLGINNSNFYEVIETPVADVNFLIS